VLAGVAAVTGVAGTSASAAPPRWALAATAAIHPGVQTVTSGSQCTANFVYTDGRNVYLGQAAHCSGTDGNTATDGCTSHSRPIGTKVQIEGATRPGVLVYNSWLTMQRLHEKNADTCAFNDLALVRVDRADIRRVNPSVPLFGGPVGVAHSGTSVGDRLYSYGNSSLRSGLTALSPKYGISLGDSNSGWNHTVYTVTPGIPGDSGSGFLDANGRALGVLSTVQLAPVPGANGVGDLARELAYLHAHTSFRKVTLVPGTQPFAPPV
jgi:hypothetical protein